MATTFDVKTPVVIQTDGSSGQNIISNEQTPQNAPSANGARKEPKDSYLFVIGSSAEFRAIFTNTDKPINVDTGTVPTAVIIHNCEELTEINGQLAQGQL